jgi:alpha-1,3-mannosyltransferase
MRIVHIVRQFHPAIGGLEGVVEALATAQVRKGHTVRVVTLDRIFNTPKAERLPRLERLNGIEIVRVPYFGSQRYPIALPGPRRFTAASWWFPRMADSFTPDSRRG